MKIGIISGHMIDSFVSNGEKLKVNTPYGNILFWHTKRGSKDVFFLNRHGEEGNLPPHRVNYRGILYALKASKVDCVLSVATVGSLKPSIKPGDIVIPDDFIDFTKNRVYSFYDDKRVHVDLSEPFCSSLRDKINEVCREMNQHCHEKGVYLATEGPRLETPAEIRMFSGFADVVGMTLVPEVVLAREKEMCYASICLVCNMAAGLQSSLSADEIVEVVMKKKPLITDLLNNVIKGLVENRSCKCRSSLEKATL